MGTPVPRDQKRASGGPGRDGLSEGVVDVMVPRRRSSLGFDGYYGQFVSYDEFEKRRSRCGDWVETMQRRDSRGDRRTWGDSQESFVLGMNDPNSPTRLSPMSSLRGATRGEFRRPGGDDKREGLGV
ncbi:hypothetical protein C8A05DRAFT_39843 [Staphylotrichum tortipilum]|uniref:Uncharacterized protein n=1 Tax=Staphylotrichum tortipilum TaxID=2831512 RepID=A0AAN6MAU4_9PEZI|nr:hypothetical protein C8A05DRAFT_39843 [Staphylotrichum longicolle]